MAKGCYNLGGWPKGSRGLNPAIDNELLLSSIDAFSCEMNAVCGGLLAAFFWVYFHAGT
jgi:hypothetical protein